ncbi:uncharacterized protein LOC127791038 [Diospyros lotus]|uniref:uncharacterized protein LOC127791038 n=1 Tax=Diospyros lotus TaxID=55363 RepID=UPI002254296E|nr:uncharacterized protein LOC127791038 [Diospyros lotus]XP_052176727.1 uncharacterized protein LOC127791038 [Diospyros lotus]
MDFPITEVGVKQEKFEEEKEAGPLFHCHLFDTQIVRKIAQLLLFGLASACVDNTAGGLFTSPASVAIVMRKEMVDYLTQRSETFVAESVILEGGQESEVLDHPSDIISDFIHDFVSSKRNIFSQVSRWLLSERREDRIDDFVEEMEIDGFWVMERREAIAQILFKNVDFKNAFHCNMKYKSAKELAEHSLQCNFMTMSCTNGGCKARFCASQLEKHDSLCPFKMLPCEQQCSGSIIRREMDKHCMTVCPMKLVNCSFYAVGCQYIIPQSTIEQHCMENVHSHLLYVLQVIHKNASIEDLKKRVAQLEESAPPGRLAKAQDARMLKFAIKDLEAELGPLKVNSKIKVNEDQTESPFQKDCAELASRKVLFAESPSKNEEFQESPNKKEEHIGKEECSKSLAKKEECSNLPPNLLGLLKENANIKVSEGLRESPNEKEISQSATQEEGDVESREEREEFMELHDKKEEQLQKEKSFKSPTKKEECSNSAPDHPDPLKENENVKVFDDHTESPSEGECSRSAGQGEGCAESPGKREHHGKEECSISPTQKEECSYSPPKQEEYIKSAVKKEECKELATRNEGCTKSLNKTEDCGVRS